MTRSNSYKNGKRILREKVIWIRWDSSSEWCYATHIWQAMNYCFLKLNFTKCKKRIYSNYIINNFPLMSYFAIFVLRFWKSNLYRTAVPLNEKTPNDHIVHALSELWMYSFDYVEGVQVDINKFVPVEDEDWNPVYESDFEGSTHQATKVVKQTFEWDGEPFKEFIESFLSPKIEL